MVPKTVSRRSPRLLASLGIIFCLLSASSAQTDSSGLNGTIADSLGRVLPAVQVLVLEDATGLRREATANYMWSHEIDDSNGSGDGDSITPQNVSCIPESAPQCGERASGAFDARHVFNANGVWELPFGAGKPYLNEPGVLRTLFGSWSYSSIFTAHTGFPVNITVNRTGPDGNTVNQRPNLVPGVPLYLPGGNFNPAAFSPPAINPLTGFEVSFGDVPRNFLRGPGAWQSDMALAKHIPIREQVQLQFRAEVFNVFNKALFAPPDGNLSDSGFGLVRSPLNPTPIGMGTPRQFQFMLKAQF